MDTSSQIKPKSTSRKRRIKGNKIQTKPKSELKGPRNREGKIEPKTQERERRLKD